MSPVLLVSQVPRHAALQAKSILPLCNRLLDSHSKSKDRNLCIRLADRSLITKLNHRYRGKHRSTDVLSFPMHGDHFDGNLGEIVLCWSVICRKARGSVSALDRLTHRLIVHGFAHLLGYDHERVDEYVQMRRVEAWLSSCAPHKPALASKYFRIMNMPGCHA